MRLKVSLGREAKHKEFVTAVAWLTPEEMVSVGDDRQMLKWNLSTGETGVLATLPEAAYPTDLQWFPGAKKGGGSEVFVMASTDGKFYLISKTGRIEKSVPAHKGAVLQAKWSSDGTSLLTASEDGQVKVWSRNGMLRSTLAQNSFPVSVCCWSADSSSIMYSQKGTIHIVSLQGAAKGSQQWKAHDALILSADWSTTNGLIITGAEDCKYKLWDSFGRPLFTSSPQEYPITSLSWSYDGELFAVGSFNSLRLADKAGWSHTMEKARTGSLFQIGWSRDSTQLAGACANGHVIFASIIEQQVEWQHFHALQTKRKTVEVQNVRSDTNELLELKDRVVKLALGWNHLVVATSTQCYIYNSKNWNTPQIVDLKDGRVSMILLSPKNFILVDGLSIDVYKYEGRLVSTVKANIARPDAINAHSLAMSDDTVALRDTVDVKLVNLYDSQTGKPMGDGKVHHSQHIVQVRLDQTGSVAERRLAFIDANSDLFIANLKGRSSGSKAVKIGILVQEILFHDITPMLAGISDASLLVWTYPSVVMVDKHLVNSTIVRKESNEFGKNPRLLSYSGNSVAIRRSDGSVISVGIPPFAAALHVIVERGKWIDALKLCRHVKEKPLWGALAGMATFSKNWQVALESYAAIDEVEKVWYIQKQMENGRKDVRDIELNAVSGNLETVESNLVQAGQSYKAIKLCMELHKWEQALKLSSRNKDHLEIVVASRARLLERMDRPETIKQFKELNKEIEADWEHVQELIAKEEAS